MELSLTTMDMFNRKEDDISPVGIVFRLDIVRRNKILYHILV